MASSFMARDADISTSPFEIQYEHFYHVDYAVPHIIMPLVFIIKVKKQEVNWQTIVNVLSLEVWLALLGCIVLLGLYLRCVIKDEDDKPLPIGNLYWSLIVTLCNQGVNVHAINRFTSRLTFGLWLLSISVLLWGYGNVLESSLAVRENKPIPRTFEQLASALERREYSCFSNLQEDEIEILNKSKIGYINTLAKHFYSSRKFLLKQFRKEDITDLKDKFIKTGSSKNMELYINRSKLAKKFIKMYGETSQLAIVSSPGIEKSLIMDSDDQYLVSDDVLFTRNLAFIMRKGFPYKSKIDNLMRRLLETGIINKMTGTSFFERKPTPLNDPKSLSVEDLFGAFALLSTGYTLSFFCFLAEIFIEKTWNRKCFLYK
ncbi:uncharacterized protein LOC111613437 [Centruroides sculpturatus]|uniref:uncharacterized protein LOC111613437 n=1 Tax=Centruroides sculpturatus TaxID=218467 RepID=UPI000C6E454D|nr:uncharacterized protein LOC111613437 [Centruroides sculpturatus]